MDRFSEILKRSESGFIENFGDDHIPSESQVGFVDLDIPGKDETPLPLTPVLVYLHVGSVWGTPSKTCCMFVHRGLQKPILRFSAAREPDRGEYVVNLHFCHGCLGLV